MAFYSNRYEKCPSVLLSTAMVGYAAPSPDAQRHHSGGNSSSTLAKLIGPGHASFLQDRSSKDWYAVYHASRGQNCNRYAITRIL